MVRLDPKDRKVKWVLKVPKDRKEYKDHRGRPVTTGHPE
jgi:hypothetical protein